MKVYLKKNDGAPSMKIINLKHDFPSKWQEFLNPNDIADGNVLDFKLPANHFPFRDSGHNLKISEITTIRSVLDLLFLLYQPSIASERTIVSITKDKGNKIFPAKMPYRRMVTLWKRRIRYAIRKFTLT